MNAVIDRKDYATPDFSLKIGDITLAALENIDNQLNTARIDELTLSSLKAAAGMTQEVEPVRTDKEVTRNKLLNFALKQLEPERVFQQLCAGVAMRRVNANDAFWLAQRIVSSACDLAVREAVRRKREEGVTAGFTIDKDDAGVWEGQEATNVDVLARDNRANTNIFSQIDDADTVEATFKDWYKEVEVPLSALASATMMREGFMQYGEHSRWVETSQGWEQVIETYDQRLENNLMLANDRNVVQLQTKDNPWAKFE